MNAWYREILKIFSAHFFSPPRRKAIDIGQQPDVGHVFATFRQEVTQVDCVHVM